MRGAERGFLLLTSHLGDPERKPLTTAQFRMLAERIRSVGTIPERDVEPSDLTALGYGAEMSRRIAALLGEEERLDYYLYKAARAGCTPITRVSEKYPLILRKRLGNDSPGVLWAKGDLSLLEQPAVALVGSRELLEPNRAFAAEVGRQAALQEYVLVSGNARGADRTAQNACLEAGGGVICVIADSLAGKHPGDRMLCISEDMFDAEFSAQRALSRNRCIHALGLKTFVAQSNCGTGGTWDGTVKNLHNRWSSVYCCNDGSCAVAELEQMGAILIGPEELVSFYDLPAEDNLFDR